MMPNALKVVTKWQGRLDKNYFVKYIVRQRDRRETRTAALKHSLAKKTATILNRAATLFLME